MIEVASECFCQGAEPVSSVPTRPTCNRDCTKWFTLFWFWFSLANPYWFMMEDEIVEMVLCGNSQ